MSSEVPMPVMNAPIGIANAARREPGDDHEARTDGRSRRDADDAGVGEGVAEHALHDRAGGGERGSDEDRERHAREAHLPQRGIGVGVARLGAARETDPAADGSHDLRDRDLHLAERGREQRGEDQAEPENDEQQRHLALVRPGQRRRFRVVGEHPRERIGGGLVEARRTRCGLGSLRGVDESRAHETSTSERSTW
jgi:hypothetical protein